MPVIIPVAAERKNGWMDGGAEPNKPKRMSQSVTTVCVCCKTRNVQPNETNATRLQQMLGTLSEPQVEGWEP